MAAADTRGRPKVESFMGWVRRTLVGAESAEQCNVQITASFATVSRRQRNVYHNDLCFLCLFVSAIRKHLPAQNNVFFLVIIYCCHNDNE